MQNIEVKLHYLRYYSVVTGCRPDTHSRWIANHPISTACTWPLAECLFSLMADKSSCPGLISPVAVVALGASSSAWAVRRTASWHLVRANKGFALSGHFTWSTFRLQGHTSQINNESLHPILHIPSRSLDIHQTNGLEPTEHLSDRRQVTPKPLFTWNSALKRKESSGQGIFG